MFPGAIATFGVSAPSPDPTGYAFVTTFMGARRLQQHHHELYRDDPRHQQRPRCDFLLWADYTFTASDRGVHCFSVTINTPGNQTIKGTDTVESAAGGTTTVTVANYVPGLHFTATSSSPTVAVHSTYAYTVTALDSNNQVGVYYNGTIHFRSSDPNAVLPADYTFTNADQGVHTFNITLDTVASFGPGSVSLTRLT